MCNCKTDIEAKLAERAVKAGASEAKVTLQGYGLTLAGDTMKLAGLMEYTVNAATVAKDGSTKRKKTRGNMIFSFCPFCGARPDGEDGGKGGAA